MIFNIKDIKLIPNLISIFRLLLTIPFIYIFITINDIDKRNHLIILLIVIAFISDISDGFLARKLNQVTELGKIIDPIADKTLVAIIVFFFWKLNYIDNIYFILILLRDITILSGGLIISKISKKIVMSDYIGKITVFLIGIFFIFILMGFNNENLVYNVFYYLTLIMSLISLINYSLKAIKTISN